MLPFITYIIVWDVAEAVLSGITASQKSSHAAVVWDLWCNTCCVKMISPVTYFCRAEALEQSNLLLTRAFTSEILGEVPCNVMLIFWLILDQY